MEQTTNYSLRKYQSGDLFNPLTVNNPNLDDIDADMKAISDRAIGRATELVSQGVHAITLIDTDCKMFSFIATGNYSAGETFTVNGIQCNAYTPSGSALTSNAFVTGSVVIGSLNEDGTAITFYVTGSAVSDDSLKLGGELPSYYATQSDMTEAETDITNLQNQAGNTSIVGIGDGTLSGAISSLNNDLNKQWTLLWTNQNPTSDFSAQTVVLNLTGYRFIFVDCIYQTSVTSEKTGAMLPNINGCGACVLGGIASNVRGRHIKITSTGVEFEAGKAGDITANNVVVPQRIYGIR